MGHPGKLTRSRNWGIPHLSLIHIFRRTLEVYEGVPEYVRTFAADEREMTKYIIGTISGKDVPRTPQTQGALGRMAYFRGLTVEMLQKERDQILNATVEDIHAQMCIRDRI